MAKKKAVDETIEGLKSLVEEKKVIFGKDQTLRGLRNGKISKVFVSSNANRIVKEDIKHYCEISNIEYIELEKTNQELGFICKRPHLVSILSVKADGKD